MCESNRPVFRWRATPDDAVLERCEGALGHVRLPERALGLPVVGIGARAFYNAKGLTGIDLSPGLRFIGENAFLGCVGLRAVTLPEGLSSLGSGTFEGCTALREVRFGEGLTALPDRAFYLCRALERAALPSTLRAIGESAFSGCAALTGLALPEGLEAIGPRALAGCAALRALRVPLSVNRLDATSLPVQLQTRGGLFLPGSGLLVRATVSLRWAAPEGTRIIADGALAGNHDLTEVTLPETVEVVGDRAFADCRCLHRINLPLGLKRLGAGAFADCRGLRALSLPDDCTRLPDGLFENSGLVRLALPEGVFALGDRCFAGCGQLTEIQLNPGLKAIGAGAFARCTSLRALTLPTSLESIGPQALLDCRGLEVLTLSGGLPRGLDRALTDLRRVVLVAPELPPEAFPPLWRKRVCLGFARAVDQGIPITPQVRDTNLDWLRAHAAALAADAAGDAALLRLMLDHRLLSDADALRLVERLTPESMGATHRPPPDAPHGLPAEAPCAHASRPELTVELLNYIHSHASEADEDLW